MGHEGLDTVREPRQGEARYGVHGSTGAQRRSKHSLLPADRPRAYPFSAYDRNLCLKMSAAMWVSLGFLLRPYVIVVASISNRADRTGIIHTFYPDKTAMAIGALMAIPAMMLPYAWIMRQRGQQGLPRRIWTHGRELMLLLAVANVAALAFPLLLAVAYPSPGVVSQLAACALLIWYLLRSQRVIDTFADYPD